MKILVLTTRLFAEPTSGGEICTARLLAALRRGGHDIVLAGRGDADGASVWAPEVISLGDIVGPFEELGPATRLAAVAMALFSGSPITVCRQRVRLSAERVASLVAPCDAVIVDHLQAWPWLRDVRSRPVLLLNHNVESDNYLRQSRDAFDSGVAPGPVRWLRRELLRREAAGLRRLELTALEHAHVLACLSEGDSERMYSLAIQAQCKTLARPAVLPGYPLAVPLRRHRISGGRPATVGLLGTWTWAPNREGLKWFLAEVWPALAGRMRLVLAGSGLAGLALPEQTQVMGRIGHVSEFYEAVDVVAVVSLSGTGVQEKAIEAIGSGASVVATRHALRGLLPGLPGQVRIEDEPLRFAQACVKAASNSGVQAHNAALSWARQRRQTYERSLGTCLNTLSAFGPRSDAAGASSLAAAS